LGSGTRRGARTRIGTAIRHDTSLLRVWRGGRETGSLHKLVIDHATTEVDLTRIYADWRRAVRRVTLLWRLLPLLWLLLILTLVN